MKITKSYLRKIIKEEVSIGFGQGTPAQGDLYNKRIIAMEEAAAEIPPEVVDTVKDEMVAAAKALAPDILAKFSEEIENVAAENNIAAATLKALIVAGLSEQA